MGREIRLVPPNWEHPKNDSGDYIPMHESNYLEALNKWFENHRKWETGENKDRETAMTDYNARFYAEWFGDPPGVSEHVKYTSDEGTWFQLYETVTEGTPITPPFETKEELIEYLVGTGDDWRGRWSTKGATQMVNSGWQMTGMLSAQAGFVSGNLLAEALADSKQGGLNEKTD